MIKTGKNKQGDKPKIPKWMIAPVIISVIILLLVISFPSAEITAEVPDILVRAEKYAQAINSESNKNDVLQDIAVT